MRNNVIRAAYCTALTMVGILLISGIAFAEGIFMTDGRIIYGRILSQDNTLMRIRTSYGVVNLKKGEIRKIDYDLGLGQVTVVLKRGDFVHGVLISITATKVIVKEGDIDKDIPRSEIENLVLQKFEGRRDNTFGLMMGITKTVGSLNAQVPYGYIDLTAYYLRSSAELPFFLWGASASCIRLSTNDNKTRLRNARMTLYPLMIDFRLRYPILSLVSSSGWASGISFFAGCGGGVSYVSLEEGSGRQSGTYFSMQPGIGFTVYINERISVTNQYDYLYIHQKECSYTGLRGRIGFGYDF